MEPLNVLPSTSAFTPLSEFQSRTPSSFTTGPPVLYHHTPYTTLKILARGLRKNHSTLLNLIRKEHTSNGMTTAAVNGDAAEEEEEEAEEEVEVLDVGLWITSECLLLYPKNTTTTTTITASSSGISIPYPSISLHAIQRSTPTSPSSLFLQILSEAGTFDDHDPDATITITITPNAPANAPTETSTNSGSSVEAGAETPQSQEETQLLYAALSACANLHPSPQSSDGDPMDRAPSVMFEGDHETDGIYPLSNGAGSEGAALPPPFPGSGGWITMENMGEYFDEGGNWRGGAEGEAERLGAGAGITRTRDDEDGEVNIDDNEGGGEETKWRRTD